MRRNTKIMCLVFCLTTLAAAIVLGAIGGSEPYLTRVTNRLIEDSDIENSSIGAVTPGDGAFTTLTTTGAFSPAGLVSGTAGMTITGGVVNLNVSSNNAVNVGTGTTTSTVTVGGSAAQTITIGAGAAAKTVTVGSSNTTSTTDIDSGSGGINLNVSVNEVVNIGTGTATGTVTLGGTGTQSIAVGDGAGIKTVTVGSATTTSATTITAGTGGFNLITGDDFQLAGGGIIGDINDITADGTSMDPWGVSDLDSSSGALTFALGSPAAGVDAVGLTKVITMSTAGNNATITVTLHSTSDPEVFLFDAADEALGLVWTGTEWTTDWSVGVTLP